MHGSGEMFETFLSFEKSENIANLTAYCLFILTTLARIEIQSFPEFHIAGISRDMWTTYIKTL